MEMAFELKDGRKIELASLTTRLTYYSALEGSEESLSSLYRAQGLADWVRSIGQFTGCPAVQVFDPGTRALPPVLCVAFFLMYGEGQQDEVFRSQLLVGWYADSLEYNSRDLVSQVVKKVDWDENAEVLLSREL